jgi:Na+-translocating ferredoxin:NAD+ oxidoreductase RNF subunit RnfB
MWNRILTHKKKLIALLLAAILAVAGINLKQEQQDAIVDTVSDVLPDAPAVPE